MISPANEHPKLEPEQRFVRDNPGLSEALAAEERVFQSSQQQTLMRQRALFDQDTARSYGKSRRWLIATLAGLSAWGWFSVAALALAGGGITLATVNLLKKHREPAPKTQPDIVPLPSPESATPTSLLPEKSEQIDEPKPKAKALSHPAIDRQPQEPVVSWQQELQAFKNGELMRKAGNFDQAIVAYQNYLDTFSKGRLAQEVRVSLFGCFVNTQRWADAAALGQFLIEQKISGPNRPIILHHTAHALAQSDQCQLLSQWKETHALNIPSLEGHCSP